MSANSSQVYDIPDWADVPPSGSHLDVMKGDKLVQKVMVDHKKHYLFGRNPQQNDICIDHASCSRIHAALVYHKHLDRAFLIDLGSTHGTFIGTLRLEPNKPTQLQLDCRFHFGASTRQYVLRQRPINPSRPIIHELERQLSDNDGTLLGLPEADTELDNLTEYNTAHNRRISMLGITDDDRCKKKRKRLSVSFSGTDEVINPEDIDPTIGRFRNLVQSTVIPSEKKRPRLSSGLVPHQPLKHHLVPKVSLYEDFQVETQVVTPYFTTLSTKLGMSVPNPAPEIEDIKKIEYAPPPPPTVSAARPPPSELMDEPKRKKYAKEAWPGKKHSGNLLV